MEPNSIGQQILVYEQQLQSVNEALAITTNSDEKERLIELKEDIEQLLQLTRETQDSDTLQYNEEGSGSSSAADNEYEQFMVEMRKEGAVQQQLFDLTSETEHSNPSPNNNKEPVVVNATANEYDRFMTEMREAGAVDEDNDNTPKIPENVKALEGTKCKAPHKHNWGDIVYHNAVICSILNPIKDDFEVKIMFINPTHKEMLPCPYYLDLNCKFTEDKCHFSHGEVLLLSNLKDYVAPNFESVQVGSKILAKGVDKLWHRASIKRLFSEKCIVKFELNSKDMELELHDILPLGDVDVEDDCDLENTTQLSYEDIINMSLVVTPTSQALGEWEKFTKGIGSKLMAKMGYISGSGLGRHSSGILEPVSAVVLPAGKSLDYCMNLREHAVGDKDIFKVERKLRRLQKKQELRNQKAYEREKNRVDVFNFLNSTLGEEKATLDLSLNKSKHRQEIKNESVRSLNVTSLKIEETIRKTEADLFKIRDSLKRNFNTNSQIHRNLLDQLHIKQNELKALKDQALNVKNEQSSRYHEKILTKF